MDNSGQERTLNVRQEPQGAPPTASDLGGADGRRGVRVSPPPRALGLLPTRRRATAVGRWRRRGRIAGAKHRVGESKHAGQAHWLGGHQDKRVSRHGGIPPSRPRADHQPGRGDFAAFRLPEGGTFEVFGPRDRDHAHFSTGPVVGFVVDDLPGAVRELEAAGVDSWGGRWMSAAEVGAIFARRTATSMS